MTTYRKTMREALEEMHDSLNEDNMDLLSKAAGGAMQTLKMKDGKLQLDSFTASAIKKVYDKVNPANQKKMSDMINNGTKSSIMKLQDFVMKQIKSSYNEELDLDEGYLELTFKSKQDAEKAYNKINNEIFAAGSVPYDDMNQEGNEIQFDLDGNLNRRNDILKDLKSGGIKNFKVTANEDLDEGTWATPDTPKEKAALKKLLSKPLKAKDASDKLYDLVGDDEMYDDLGDYADKNPNDDVRAMVKSHMKRLGIKEEADLDEKSRQLKDPKKEVMVVKKGEVIVIDKKDQDNYMKKGWKLAEGNDLDEASVNIESLPFKSLMDVVNDMMKQLPKSDKKNYEKEVAKVLKTMGVKSEELELDEATKWKIGDGKPRGGSNIENVRFWDLSKDELQYIMKDAGAAMKANPTAKKATSGPGNYADQVNDATTVLGWRKKNGIKEDAELGEGAAADARRAMARDKDFSRRDSADDDNVATDDDVKAASKNILMQLRKAISLKSFNVEFGDGKHKVDAKIAQAVQNKYNSMRRPADKEKYQMQIAKSYKGMLQSLKAGYHGEQKESILSRIDRKLKERKNG